MVNFFNSGCVDMVLLYGLREDLHHGTRSPRSWYLQLQTHDRGRNRTERILQAGEQILEEPDITEVGVSQFVVHRTLKEQDHINHSILHICCTDSFNIVFKLISYMSVAAQ